MAGAYWFASPSTLRRALDVARSAVRVGDEFYLSKVFEFIPGKKFSMPVMEHEYLEFGTPEKLDSFLQRQAARTS